MPLSDDWEQEAGNWIDMTLQDVDELTAAEFGYTDDIARHGLRMMFHSKHRPLEAYSRALEASGFVIESIREHPIPEEGVRADRSRRWRRIPLFLHVRARKPA